jgi:hypothetical protein
MDDHSTIMWLTNEKWEANNGRNANVYSSLLAIGGGGGICPNMNSFNHTVYFS